MSVRYSDEPHFAFEFNPRLWVLGFGFEIEGGFEAFLALGPILIGWKA